MECKIVMENIVSDNDIKINDVTLDSIVIGATIDYMGNVTELAKLEGKGWYSAYIINSDGSLVERRKFSKSEFAEAFNVFGENGSTGDNNLFYLPDLQNRTKRHIGENILYKELQNFATSLNGISATTLSNCSSVSPSNIGVSIMAGQMTLARIFIGANSLAIERVKLITPPLEAA